MTSHAVRILLLGACLALVPPAAASARSLSPVSGHVARNTWKGLVLTLKVLGGDLSRNALVRASVTVTNRSKRARHVYFRQCANGPGSPDIQVLNDDGSEAPLLQAQHPFVPCGPPFRQASVAPGGHVTETDYLVLTGDVVQGSAHIGKGDAAQVMTATIHLHLLDAPAPSLQLHSSPPVSALIQPPPGVSGPLYFKSWTGCYDAQGNIGSGMQFTFWQTADGQTITPQEDVTACASWEWHAVAGWLNHPVVAVNEKVGTSPFTGP
jgi:hypothetical protein